MSFAGLGFLSLYLAGKMHLWDNGGHRVSQHPLKIFAVHTLIPEFLPKTRAWAALSPLLGAAMVAISRTEDNRRRSTCFTLTKLLCIWGVKHMLICSFAHRPLARRPRRLYPRPLHRLGRLPHILPPTLTQPMPPPSCTPHRSR